METQNHTYHYHHPFELESGEKLPGFQLRYTTLGKINSNRSNVVWVCHALTGNADVTQWWKDLFEEGSAFDPEHNLIICVNILGGCYGSTGPLSVNPETGKPWFHSFPLLTNRDVVKAFDLLREHLQLTTINTILGGSLGGQHALEWIIYRPDVFQHAILIACNAVHSPWGIAFNEAQRLAIEADPSWNSHDERAGLAGLKAARAMAILSYRHYSSFAKTQQEKNTELLDGFRAASYQRYQGEKLSRRYNAFSYWTLSKMMDSHNVGRGRGTVEQALRQIESKTLLIGIDNDLLFPVTELQFLENLIPGAELNIISSSYGHDGFLLEYDQLLKSINQFFKKSLSTISL